MLKRINHIGIAVQNLGQARDFYNSVFKLESSTPLVEKDFRVSMMQIGDIKIELMDPVGSEGVIAQFLEKRGEGIHHICFEVYDIASALASIEAKGMELINREPQAGAEGKFAFLHPKTTHGVLIELVEIAGER